MTGNAMADALGITLDEDNKRAEAAEAEAKAKAEAERIAAMTPEERRLKLLEDDTELARQTIVQSINQNNTAIDHLMNISRESMSPRAFEVLAGMIRHNADIAEKMLKIHADKQKVQNNAINLVRNEQAAADPLQAALTGGTTINANNIAFIGSTTELLKMLKQEQKRVVKVQDSKIIEDNDV